MDDPKLRGLGRGLNALFEDEEGVYPQIDPEGQTPAGRRRDLVGIEQLEPGSLQPRQHFDEEALGQLAESIRTHGLLQPLVVRPDPVQDDKYEIVAGERRWRAAQKAQLHEVPVVILTLDDTETLEIALIENLQREDLNPVEEARGYKKLMESFGHTQEKIGEALGKSRSHVANMVRLLGLPEVVLTHVESGKLSMGHARALITCSNPEEIAKEIIARGLSVREAEELASGTRADEAESSTMAVPPSSLSTGPIKRAPEKDVNTAALEEELTNVLGMKVRVLARKGGKGTVKIDYKSLDQLDEVIARLKGAEAPVRLSQ